MTTDPIGVAGLGYLGRGIAACFLAHGFRVIGYTVGRDTHEIAREYIAGAIGELIEKAHFPSSLAEDWQARAGLTGLDKECNARRHVTRRNQVVEDRRRDDIGPEIHRAILDQHQRQRTPYGVSM